jgi:hypothetical protein
MPNDSYDLGSYESNAHSQEPSPRTSYTLNPEAIPDELKRGTLFSPFRIERGTDGKLEKVPFNAKTGNPYEKGTMLDNLVSFDEALAACVKYGGNSVVRRFTKDDSGGFIDIDFCFDRESGELFEWALKGVEVANSYSERSVSGNGIHIVGRFKQPHNLNKLLGGRVEIYDSDQFMVLTGDVIGDAPAKVNDIQHLVDDLYKQHLALSGSFNATEVVPGASGPGNEFSDEEVLMRARNASNGEKFCQLFDEGDISSYYGDNSSADLALVGSLAFWTAGDRDQIDRLFRQSALMREKWDEPNHRGDGATYGEMTIDRAIAGRGPDDFYTPERNTTEEEAETVKGSLADKLVAYALGTGGELFVDQLNAPHVFVDSCPLPLTSRCHSWLRRLMWEQQGKTVSTDALRTAAGTLAAFAEDEGVVRELHTRAAFYEGTLFYELEPSRVIRVDGSGWGFAASPPVLFRRLANLKALPDPEYGGNIEDIYRFVNLKSERDKRLFCAYVVTLALPHVARPILLATGAMGSGKSTTSRVIKRLWDPTEPEAVRPDPRDFLQKASHCFVVMLDNQSRLDAGMSDTFCRLVTGEADSKRRLYSDDEDIIYSLRRAILLNGINVPTERGDVLDRSLAVELERLSDTERRTEEEMWDSFDEAHPGLLGAAFRLLSQAIAARPRLALARSPRLADWGYYAAGVYEAMGWGANRFLEDWDEVVEVQEQTTLEGSPVAQAILYFMDEHPEGYEGTATELHEKLTFAARKLGVDILSDKAWPSSCRWMWRRIKEVMPLLTSRGVLAEKGKGKAGTIIRLSKTEAA